MKNQFIHMLIKPLSGCPGDKPNKTTGCHNKITGMASQMS